MMMNGRPAEDHFFTKFLPENSTQNETECLNNDVSGWQVLSTQIQKGQLSGKGKQWLPDGSIFIGEYQCDRMSEGVLYEMNPDDTANLFSVKYDWNEDLKKGLPPNKQVPIQKKLI